MTVQNHEQRLLEINTLQWDELLAPGDPNKMIDTQQGGKTAYVQHTSYEQHNLTGYSLNGVSSSLERMSTVNNLNEITFQTVDGQLTSSFLEHEFGGNDSKHRRDSFDSLNKARLQTQDSFGRWMNYLITDSPGSTDDPTPEYSVSTGQSYAREQIFSITEISPVWDLSTEETRVLSSNTCCLDTMVLFARRKMLSVVFCENLHSCLITNFTLFSFSELIFRSQILVYLARRNAEWKEEHCRRKGKGT